MHEFLTTPMSDLGVLAYALLSFLLVGAVLAIRTPRSDSIVVLRNYLIYASLLTGACVLAVAANAFALLPITVTIEPSPLMFCVFNFCLGGGCVAEAENTDQSQSLCFLIGLVGGIYGVAGVLSLSPAKEIP